MKLSYLIYGFLVSGWVFTDAPVHNRSRWWALATLILPILTPYYLIKTRPSNKYWKLIAIWIVGFAAFHAAETTLLKNTIKQGDSIHSLSVDKTNIEWNRINLGTSGFSISSPIPLKPIVREIPEELQIRVKKMEFYECDSKHFMLFVSIADYLPDKEVTLQDAITGSMENLSSVQGVSNFQFSQSPVVLSGRKGSALEGTFLSGGKEVWSFRCSIVMDGQKAWQVLGMYPQNNLMGKDIVKSILSSVEFQDNRM